MCVFLSIFGLCFCLLLSHSGLILFCTPDTTPFMKIFMSVALFFSSFPSLILSDSSFGLCYCLSFPYSHSIFLFRNLLLYPAFFLYSGHTVYSEIWISLCGPLCGLPSLCFHLAALRIFLLLLLQLLPFTVSVSLPPGSLYLSLSLLLPPVRPSLSWIVFSLLFCFCFPLTTGNCSISLPLNNMSHDYSVNQAYADSDERRRTSTLSPYPLYKYILPTAGAAWPDLGGSEPLPIFFA